MPTLLSQVLKVFPDLAKEASIDDTVKAMAEAVRVAMAGQHS